MTFLKQISMFLSLMAFVCVSASAQGRAPVINASLSDQATVRKVTSPTYIPAGSRVYVADINGLPGFENNLVAAFQKRRVNLLVVADRTQADFEINGFAQSEKASWAKIIFGSGRPESEASIQMVNLRSGVVAYAVASTRSIHTTVTRAPPSIWQRTCDKKWSGTKNDCEESEQKLSDKL